MFRTNAAKLLMKRTKSLVFFSYHETSHWCLFNLKFKRRGNFTVCSCFSLCGKHRERSSSVSDDASLSNEVMSAGRSIQSVWVCFSVAADGLDTPGLFLELKRRGTLNPVAGRNSLYGRTGSLALCFFLKVWHRGLHIYNPNQSDNQLSWSLHWGNPRIWIYF